MNCTLCGAETGWRFAGLVYKGKDPGHHRIFEGNTYPVCKKCEPKAFEKLRFIMTFKPEIRGAPRRPGV